METIIYQFPFLDTEFSISNAIISVIINYDIILDNLKKESYTNIVLKKFGIFLTTKNLDKLEQLSKGDIEYMDAFQKIEDLSRDEDFIGYYDYEERRKWEHDSLSREMKEKGLAEGLREGIKEGIKEGREEGLAEGRKEGQRTLLEKLHVRGKTISEISELLGMSETEIKRILTE